MELINEEHIDAEKWNVLPKKTQPHLGPYMWTDGKGNLRPMAGSKLHQEGVELLEAKRKAAAG